MQRRQLGAAQRVGGRAGGQQQLDDAEVVPGRRQVQRLQTWLGLGLGLGSGSGLGLGLGLGLAKCSGCTPPDAAAAASAPLSSSAAAHCAAPRAAATCRALLPG